MSNIKGFTNTQKIKEEAANWLLIIEEKSPLSTKESQALRDWVATSSVHRAVIIRMSETWNNMDVLAAMRVNPERKTRFSMEKIKALLGAIILTTLFKQNDKATHQGYSLFFKLSTVAVCFIASLLFIDLMFNEGMTRQPNYYVTDIGEYKKHILEDGSTLWLNSNSKVKVDYSKNFRRIALITGEAHFEVKKDASRPFEVYSMNRLVRALGTAFSVRKLNDRVEVMVSEGTVELAIVDEMLVLTPDDLLIIKDIKLNKKENRKAIVIINEPAKVSKYLGKLSAGESMSIPMISSALIENGDNRIVYLGKGEIGRKLSWLDGKLVFAGESLEEVVSEISRHTSIKINIHDPELRKMRIGGHFEAGETDKLFSILESGFGIEVNRIDKNHVELLTKK
ncbi:MAG: transmembrane sensor [Alteromonadaceae bacterium]|jgi:transmembrane sensor